MPRRGSDAGAEIDALFQLSLAEFTGARNVLAKRLAGEGRTLDAERVKAIAKPPAPAWAVNQLYWQDPKAIERLLALGERVRKVQTGQLANTDLRKLLEEKKQVTKVLLNKASAILEEAGHAASIDAMRRVSATLESLAAWGETEGVPRAGRLTADLDPPGFDTLAALMGGKRVAEEKVLRFRAPKSDARPDEAVQAAEKALREAQRVAERAEAALAKADARAAAVEKQKQEIEARYAEAKEAVRLASDEAKKAARAVSDAERSLAKARSRR